MLFVKQKEINSHLVSLQYSNCMQNKNLTYVPHQAKVCYRETLTYSVQMLLLELVSKAEKKIDSSISVSQWDQFNKFWTGPIILNQFKNNCTNTKKNWCQEQNWTTTSTILLFSILNRVSFWTGSFEQCVM